MKAVLADAGCEISFAEEKHPLEYCYSVNLSSGEAPKHIYSNGKGICTEASMASALGEYIERLQTNTFFSDLYLPNRNYYPDQMAFDFGGDYLNNTLRQIYNPNQELKDEDFIDFNSDYKDQIVTLPFVNYTSKERVYFPLNILNNLYVSNGLATGNTPLEAQVQALSEIFERYVKLEIIKKGYALPAYPEETLRSFKKVYHDVTALRKSGYIVEVLDASMEGKYPVTAISLINPDKGTLFVSFGAHPLLEVSLERTMTELMQGRNMENLDTFETPTFDMSIVSDHFNLESHFIDSNGKLGFSFLSSRKTFAYTSWVYNGTTTQDELNYLTEILHSMDKEMYLREYNYLGFYSCQVIIPGVSEIYPIEDLAYNNKNTGKQIRDMVLHFTKYDSEEILDKIEPLDESLGMGNYIGVIFKNDFTMAQFKAQIYLLSGYVEDALRLLEFGDDPMGHIVAELIRMQTEGFLFEEYKEALFAVFTPRKVEKALRILKGEAFLIDTDFHQDYHNILALYDRLESKKALLVK